MSCLLRNPTTYFCVFSFFLFLFFFFVFFLFVCVLWEDEGKGNYGSSDGSAGDREEVAPRTARRWRRGEGRGRRRGKMFIYEKEGCEGWTLGSTDFSGCFGGQVGWIWYFWKDNWDGNMHAFMHGIGWWKNLVYIWKSDILFKHVGRVLKMVNVS